MKGGGAGGDEDEYGSFYGGQMPSSSSSSSSSNRLYPRYRDYSPGHQQQQTLSSSQSTLGDQTHYGLHTSNHNPRTSYARNNQYTTATRNIVDYPPPCCHQYYHTPHNNLTLHQSPNHFNTIPHPPLQYRDAPGCGTLNRSYGSTARRSSHQHQPSPYTTYYAPPTESPYADPRSEIYYTSTLTRHPRQSTRYTSDHSHHSHGSHSDTGGTQSTKLYDPPPPPLGYGGSNPQHHQQHTLRNTYIHTPQTSALLRLDEPRIYSSSALQLGTPTNSQNITSIQRSNSPQHHHFIDRSISLIRLDNSGLVIPPGSSDSQNQSSQGRIKFPTDILSGSPSIQQQPSSTSTLLKTTIELGSSNDPLQNPCKPKFKIIMENPGTGKQNSGAVVEMFDKGVMTSALPEQWSLVSSTSSTNERRGSSGATPPATSPPPALSGGIPDLLPTCVARHSTEFSSGAPWRNSVASPRRSGSGNPGNRVPKTGVRNHDLRNHRPISRWAAIKSYIRIEMKTFFGLVENSEDLKEEWLSRRKRFASRRYSERNVDSMPPPSPYLHESMPIHGGGGANNDQADGRGLDQPIGSIGRRGRRTKKKQCVFVIYWNIIRWLFWSIRFGRAGQRVAAGAGCGSDTSGNPGSGSTTPGRVPLNSQISRNRTKSRSATPLTLADIPPNVTISPQELFFDDVEDNHRNSTHHLQPPGRGLHWRIGRSPPSGPGYSTSNRISSQILSKVLDNSARQAYRQGLRDLSTSSASRGSIRDEYEDFRPYFTYWVSIVHVIVLVVSMVTYGLAPVGLDLHRKSALVLVTSLSLQQMEIVQPANFWIGPSATDLIHLGAKYAPCMRRDDKIYRRIIETRDQERQTACCIRNDNSGCVQSSRNECSIKGVSRTGLLSTWKKWTGKEVPGGGRISGSVCGLDPKFCEAPASIAPYEWPDDITKWPICRKTRGLSGMSTKDKTAEHMVCEVIGHPCCIGIHAKCVITTREYCRFVSGYFHEEASLCSQVSCLQDVCGMFPFLAYESPDQFYRLISSLFLHAGLGHILISLLFHWFIMRDLEKLGGPLRIAVIYLGSGIAGNLASVLLEPHRAEVGPGGGQFGLMACLLVELLHMWGMLRRPWQALGKMLLVTIGLFLIGFLPWVDNFAHSVGFATGFLLSHALMPYIAFGKYSSYRKWVEVVICLKCFLGLLIGLLVLFYAGFGDCEFCRLLNCLPLTQDFCAEQEIDLKPAGGGINLIT